MTDHLVDVAGGVDGEEDDNDMVVFTFKSSSWLSVVPILQADKQA